MTIINTELDVYGDKYTSWDKAYGTLEIDCGHKPQTTNDRQKIYIRQY